MLANLCMSRGLNHEFHDLLAGLDIDVRAAGAPVTLGGNNLVVVVAKGHAVLGPGVEMSLHVDRATDTLGVADRKVLLESPGAVNRGLVGAGGGVDVVGAAVGVHSAL